MIDLLATPTSTPVSILPWQRLLPSDREALLQGLGRANEVLIVADGAVWIWNLAGVIPPRCRWSDSKTG